MFISEVPGLGRHSRRIVCAFGRASESMVPGRTGEILPSPGSEPTQLAGCADRQGITVENPRWRMLKFGVTNLVVDYYYSDYRGPLAVDFRPVKHCPANEPAVRLEKP